MKELKAKKLTLESFKPYGSFQDLYDIENMRRTPPGESGFYPDLLSLNLSSSTLPSVSVSKVKKRDNVVDMAEYHRYSAEGLLPLDGDCLIFVGKACRGLDGDGREAFVVPRGVFVRLNPGVAHGSQFPVSEEWVRIVILLPEHTFENDTVKKVFDSSEQLRLTL